MKFLVSHEIRYMKQNRQIGGGRKLGDFEIYTNEGLVTVHEYTSSGKASFSLTKIPMDF